MHCGTSGDCRATLLRTAVSLEPFCLLLFRMIKMSCIDLKCHNQCQAINVGFELYIGIESKLSISIVGFDLELGEFCHDFHSISIPINHSGTHFNLPAISTSLK